MKFERTMSKHWNGNKTCENKWNDLLDNSNEWRRSTWNLFLFDMSMNSNEIRQDLRIETWRSIYNEEHTSDVPISSSETRINSQIYDIIRQFDEMFVFTIRTDGMWYSCVDMIHVTTYPNMLFTILIEGSTINESIHLMHVIQSIMQDNCSNSCC
jgi:hypothetical protein